MLDKKAGYSQTTQKDISDPKMWRKSEIINLTWTQVDLKQGIVRLEVGDPKNKQGRTVYLDEEVKEVFERQKKSGKLSPFVFPNRKGTGKIKAFRKPWDKACQEAKIGNRIFHDFRRSAVRDMVRSGIPERVAMMISSHKTRTVFERYNSVSDTDLREAAARREAYQQTQRNTISGTIHDFPQKKASQKSS